MSAAETMIHPLRPDLEIVPGPVEPGGEPTWTLHDPLRGVYHRLGWMEAGILRLCRKPTAVAELTRQARRLVSPEATDETVQGLYMRARAQGLTTDSTARPVEALLAEGRKRSLNPFQWAFNHYLYFRITLGNPDAYLSRALPYVRLFGSWPVLMLYGVLLAVGLGLVATRIEQYFGTFLYFFTPEGLLVYGLTIAALKTVHEFAHAFTAKHFGVRVPRMGIAFMILAPVAFCDVTDAWKLRDRAPRLWIGVAGVLAELGVAGIALLGWALFPDGVARSICFLLSSVTIVGTVLVNLNPGMRFDGYYLLSDLWGVDNLQARAFDATRWALRRAFLGMDLPPPEPLPRARLVGFMAYSLYTWMYRAGLYLAIAIVVYQQFHKAIGIFMFAAEIGLFLVRPVVRETVALARERHLLRLHPRLVATGLALLALLIWLVWPLPRRVEAPAILEPTAAQIVYAPLSGVVRDLRVKREMPVRLGDPLLRVASAEAEAELAQASLAVESAAARLRQATFDPAARRDYRRIRSELQRARAHLAASQRQAEQRALRAAVAGTVYQWDTTLRNGRAVRQNQVLGRIADPKDLKAIAFLGESDRRALQPGMRVWLVCAAAPGGIEGRVLSISPSPTETLRHPALASIHGGPLPVRAESQGVLKMVESVYRVEVELETDAPGIGFGTLGRLRAWSEPRSLVGDALRALHRILLRESAF